jgi:hypothetical protein
MIVAVIFMAALMRLLVVGRAILPAAAFQAALSREVRTLAPAECRLKARLKAGGSQDWLPHCLSRGREVVS